MTAFLKEQLQVWFIENKQEADRAAEQILVNKRARESAEKTKTSVKKKLSGNIDISNRVQKFVDCRSRDVSRRELYSERISSRACSPFRGGCTGFP